MRIFNRLVIVLVLALGLVNATAAFTGQKDIGVYFILDAVVYLIITMLYVHLNPRAKVALNAMSVVVFTGFLVVVALKTIEISK